MSFEKKDWKYGDTITADELNRMENGIEEALSSGGGGSAGYECKEETTLLTDESVTTMQDDFGNARGTLAYSTPIDADTIKVTFNGTKYICNKSGSGYGAPYSHAEYDWSEYPFSIGYNLLAKANNVATEVAGTYQIKVEAVESIDASITPCFEKAVIEATKPLVLNIDNDTLDKTFAEIKDAYLSGRTVLLDPVNQSPALRASFDKNYYSITEMSVSSGGGGTLVFGADVVQKYSASADDAYPTLVSN